MTPKEYNKAILLIIHLIVRNNGIGVAQAIKNYGYDSKNYIPAGDLETALLQLYIADQSKFFDVMKNISWNSGHQATNTKQISGQLKKLISLYGISIDNSNWWQTLILLLKQNQPQLIAA